ncbi:MAG: ABC transporter permease [Oscillospiraceae bacterium]|nr:ABC transporter permease [Oscillospiraceae bacterium]
MRDMWESAVRHLGRRRLRTLLTVSGILVGVALVMVVSLIGAAGRATINGELDSMGLSGLSVSSGNDGGSLSPADLQAIRGVPGVQSAMPLVLEYGDSTLRGIDSASMLCGVDAGAGQVISVNVLYGRGITPGDVRAAARVCMVDESMAKDAYARANIVGKSIEVSLNGQSETLQIVGVTETGSSVLQNVFSYMPGLVYIPYTTVQDLAGRDTFDQIAVRVSGDVTTEQAQILRALAREHGDDAIAASAGVAGGADTGGTPFRVDNLAVQRDRMSHILDIVSLILTVISGISLLVSGLGIMTIMLVSVGERTREIGIKKAIGATRWHIAGEFLLEAALLSLLGSVGGVLMGTGMAFAGVKLAGAQFAGAAVPFEPAVMGGLVLFSVALGMVFGVYPALKAAGLRPADALRSE